MNRGYILLHRRIWDNPRSKDPHWVSVWTYLLSHATHQPWRVNFDGEVIELQPGQLVTGRLKIAEQTGVHESKVKRILKTLKSDQQIDQQAGTKGSVITVLKWSEYQNGDQQTDQRVTSRRPAADQQVTTNNPHNTHDSQKTHEGEKISPTSSTVIQSFDKFWRLFPTHKGRDSALRVWSGLSETDRKAAIEGLEHHICYDYVNREVWPHRWLEDQQWMDRDHSHESNI